MTYMKSIRLLLATGFCMTAFSAPLAGQADASSRGPTPDSAAIDTLAVQDSAARADSAAARPDSAAARADSAAAPATGLVGDSAAADTASVTPAAAPSGADEAATEGAAASVAGVTADSVADSGPDDDGVADAPPAGTGADSVVRPEASADAAVQSGVVRDEAAGGSDEPGLLGAALPVPATAPGSATSIPAAEDGDRAAETGRPIDPAAGASSAATDPPASATPRGPIERGSVAGRALPGAAGSGPLGAEAPERQARPLGTSYTTLSDMRAVFAPRSSAPELEPEPEEDIEPDTTLAAVAERFRPKAGEPIGLPTDPEEAARVSRANAPLMPALGTAWGDAGSGFVEDQLRFDRVLDARLDARFRLRALFREQGLSYPPRELFIRIFKQEQLLEVWVRDGAEPDAAHQLLKRYEICAVSGRLGPKRRFQDFQAPEGFYYIEGFNPQSEFHLSLRLNYPNPADRLLGMPEQLGGDIYIHGGCATAGCFPITDAAIKELYWLAVEARGAGQEVIPVHVFPTRMTDERMRWLRGVFRADGATVEFWKNLREGYDYFERTRTLPHVMIDGLGRYRISEPAAAPDSTAAAAAG